MTNLNNDEHKNPPTLKKDLGGGFALLFINGEPPKDLPEIDGYDLICCSDGAFRYLKEKNFPMEKLDFVYGDFDSHTIADDELYREKFIFTPDQDKTDFEKSLEILRKKGIKKVDVYGASGGEMDHFLGNLTVGFKFKDDLELTFYDNFSRYFFSPKKLVLENVKGKMISLYPFPIAENIITAGLNWPLNKESLSITSRIGTRNFASDEKVTIEFEKGELIVFVEN